MLNEILIVALAISITAVAYMAVRFVTSGVGIKNHQTPDYTAMFRVYDSTGDLMFYGDYADAIIVNSSIPGSVVKGSPVIG